jgi:copper oxidase (laccase) domain-containing protein
VGEEFRTTFIGHEPTNTRFFVPAARTGHWRFDLSGFACDRLRAADIQNVAVLANCTYAEAENFYSHRRATHLGENDYGRQLSAIALL